VLQPTLKRADIPYVSTHGIAAAGDRQNFVADGHFTEAANRKITVAVLDLINQRLGR